MTEPVTPLIDIRQAKAPISLLARLGLGGHWAGTNGLLRSWVIAVPITQGVLLLGAKALEVALATQPDPRRVLAFALGFLCVSLPLEFWAWRGLFRAGGRAHAAGHRWFGRLSQAWAALGIFGLSLGGGLLAMAGYQWVALLVETRGLQPALVGASGDTLQIQGDITWSTADRVEEAMAGHRFHSVQVNSRGGSMGAGLQIARFMKQGHVQNLVIHTRCASACTALFEGAPHRVLEPGATIAAHAPFVPGGDALGYANTAREALRASYRRAGIADPWIDQALATPFNQFYAGSPDDLLRYRVIHQVGSASKTDSAR